MRYLVFSDVHDNVSALRNVLLKYDKHKCDGLIILGDICVFQDSFYELLKPYSAIYIKGNNDSYLTEHILHTKLYKEYYLDLSSNLFYLTHGEYLRFDGDYKINKNAIILFGHYHKPIFKRVSDRIYINPGSISLDRSGLGCTYIILDGNSVSCFTLDDKLIFYNSLK